MNGCLPSYQPVSTSGGMDHPHKSELFFFQRTDEKTKRNLSYHSFNSLLFHYQTEFEILGKWVVADGKNILVSHS